MRSLAARKGSKSTRSRKVRPNRKVASVAGPRKARPGPMQHFGAAIPKGSEPAESALKPSIKVFGCGGMGSNFLERFTDTVETHVELLALNTDAQHLLMVHAPLKLLIGSKTFKGRGSGGQSELVRQSLRHDMRAIRHHLKGADMVFTICGLGRGTGTGSAPGGAPTARKSGALTLGIGVLPFRAEGSYSARAALEGLNALEPEVDCLFLLQNDELLKLEPPPSLSDGFGVIDDFAVHLIQSMARLSTRYDIRPLKAIFSDGRGYVGVGKAGDGEHGKAARDALRFPLSVCPRAELKGVVIVVEGPKAMGPQEGRAVAEHVRRILGPGPRILWGVRQALHGQGLRVTALCARVRPAPPKSGRRSRKGKRDVAKRRAVRKAWSSADIDGMVRVRHPAGDLWG
jgi:cell division protein FtsZ